MERPRHRKSKSASGIEGIRQIQRQKEAARLSSDSRSYIDGRERNEMFIPEFGLSPTARAIGIPMKRLLAEEMSKEVGSKKQSPSVIARLMGLEGMPSPRHVHRQQKRSSDISINCQKNSQFYDDRANKTRWNDHQEFKDVYEDLEASHAVNRRCSSRWNTSSLTKPEMALIKQKFNDAKRLSTDEKFQDSKELDDTLEMLASNKDLLLKYLHKSDSLFVKHSHDLRSHSKSSVAGQIAVLKPSNSGKCESTAKARRPERDSSKKHRSTSPLKREDGLLLEPHSRHRTCASHHSSRIQLENNEEQILPTRIVVLKPNLAKIQKDGGSGSFLSFSHGYQPGFNKAKEFPRVGGPDAVIWTRNDSFHGEGFSKPISKEAREIAREITMRMRNARHDTETVDTKSMRLKGYAGDESSCDGNESDSERELEEFKLSSGKTFSGSDLLRYPSHSSESSVSREAKKRLSERWVVTQKYQDLEMVSKGSTLGEMLSLANREKRPHHLNAKTSLDRLTNQFACNNGPIGISSRDGWKDVIRKNVSRPRSLPPTGGRRYLKNTYYDESAEDDPEMYADHICRGKNMAMKENSSHKDDSSEDSNSRSKKPYPYEHKFANEIDSSIEAKFEIQMEANTKELTKQQSTVEMVAEDDFCRNPVSDAEAIAELRSPTLLSESSELLPTRSPSVVDADDKSPLHNPDDSRLPEQKREPPKQGSPSMQGQGAELDSPESSKEADHPSPVSVLEVPFTEVTSSSESFERVSAELHELRMQLQLLKIESGTNSQDSTLVPIEEEAVQLSPNDFEINHVNGTISWEPSYIIDLLIESALEESDFNIFRTRWPSPDCPLDPTLFDHLEKKYNDGDDTTGTRPERKLLFDTLNSAVLEIFHNHVDLYPWVQPKFGGLLNVKKEGIREALEKLISQDFVNGEMLVETVDVEMQWSDVKEEIDAIGNDIEVLLLNDVVIDFLLCW